MNKLGNIRLHAIFLPVVSLMILQASGCTRAPGSPPPPGGVYLSQSAGASFYQSVDIAGQEGGYIANFPLQQAFRSTIQPEVIYVAAGERGLIKSKDGGQTWEMIDSPLAQNRDVVQLENGTLALSGTDSEGQGFILRSLDDGKSWQSVLTIPIPKGSGFNLFGSTSNTPSVLVALSIDPFNKNRIYAGSSLGTIFAGEQSAKVWRTLHTIKPTPFSPVQSQENSGVRQLTPSPHKNGEVLVITADRRLLRIQNTTEEEIVVPGIIGEPIPQFGGATSPRKVYSASYISGFPQGLIVGVENGVVATRDGGKTWIELKVPVDKTQKFASIVADVSPTNTNRILVAINSVVYRSEDGGATWNTYSLGVPEYIITQLMIDPSNASRVLLITAPANS
ncbi:MAG: exo-alpha-sialidase [Candidatus Andersenbacteria bacterium]|nr:exo-alpha-sialidase [Candidatus Andersenbacteria bacterium]